jgi:hypothetical protein
MRILSGSSLLLTVSLFVAQADAQGEPLAPAPQGVVPAAPTNAPAPPPTAPAPSAPTTIGNAPLGAATLPPPGWQTSDIGWLNRYTVARERLVAGDFATAQELFAALASTATSGVDQAVAHELEVLAKNWKARDLVFVSRGDLGESGITAKAAGERTTDEVAVLYTGAVLYGLGTGAWIDVLTEPDSAAGFILPALGLAGAAAGAVAAVDSQRRFRYGVPQSVVSGMYIGLEEGLVLSLWNQSRVARQDEWEGKTVATVIWTLATGGAAAGAIVGSLGGTTPGRASFVGSAAMWSGVVTGMLAGAVSASENDTQDDNALLAAAVGLNAGAIAGILAAGPVSPSIARVRFLDLGGIAGGLAVGGLYFSAAGKESTGQGGLGLTALGIAGGLTTAWFATARMEPDRLPSETTRSSSALSSVLATTSVSVAPTMGGGALALRGAF